MQEIGDWAERSELSIRCIKDFIDEVYTLLLDANLLWTGLVVGRMMTGRARRTLAEVVCDVPATRCRAGVNLVVNRAEHSLRARSSRFWDWWGRPVSDIRVCPKSTTSPTFSVWDWRSKSGRISSPKKSWTRRLAESRGIPSFWMTDCQATAVRYVSRWKGAPVVKAHKSSSWTRNSRIGSEPGPVSTRSQEYVKSGSRRGFQRLLGA